MELSGTLAENLRAAVHSAKRHRGHPVRTETVQFWTDLLQEAGASKAAGAARAEGTESLIAELDAAVAERRRD
jgi:hypothetical protein